MTLNCVCLSFYWLPLACISHPQLSCEYHARITFFLLQCWWIGCHIYFHQTSPQGDQQLPLNFPYMYYDGVWMLLGLYIYCFLCVLIYFYWCILVICVNVVFSPFLVVPCLHCFYLWRHPWHWSLTGNLIIDFLWNNLSVHYPHLTSSHIVPLQCIIIIQFIIILPHIM